MNFASIRGYNYNMGFKVNGQPIPDPSSFSGSESSLDTSAKRSANGLLQRKMVAVKHPLKLEWNNIEWPMIQFILGLVETESFMFTYPSPTAQEGQTMKAYSGDRSWDVSIIKDNGLYIGKLSFSVIEY